MSAADATAAPTRRPFTGRRVRFGDVLLQLVAGAAALGATVLVGLIVWKLVDGSRLALSKYGLGFVTRVAWNPVVGHELYGAGSFLFGTIVTSVAALLIATPIAIGIALFLTELCEDTGVDLCHFTEHDLAAMRTLRDVTSALARHHDAPTGA